MKLAEFHRMGQQQQQGTMFTGVVYATAAAQLMEMRFMCQEHIKRLTLPKQIRHPPFTMIMSAYISITPDRGSSRH